MLLYVASCIIFPIIFKEGIRAVFMPFLVRKPQVPSCNLLLFLMLIAQQLLMCGFVVLALNVCTVCLLW